MSSALTVWYWTEWSHRVNWGTEVAGSLSFQWALMMRSSSSHHDTVTAQKMTSFQTEVRFNYPQHADAARHFTSGFDFLSHCNSWLDAESLCITFSHCFLMKTVHSAHFTPQCSSKSTESVKFDCLSAKAQKPNQPESNPRWIKNSFCSFHDRVRFICAQILGQ